MDSFHDLTNFIFAKYAHRCSPHFKALCDSALMLRFNLAILTLKTTPYTCPGVETCLSHCAFHLTSCCISPPSSVGVQQKFTALFLELSKQDTAKWFISI